MISSEPPQALDVSRNVPCGDPRAACPVSSLHTFAAHELPFDTQVQLQRDSLDSRPFFAVVLKTEKAISDGASYMAMDGTEPKRRCAGYVAEAERMRAQALFPERKVFASRHGCYDSALSYAGVAPEENVLAVFAGETDADAQIVLTAVKSTGKYPGAALRKMTARLVTAN